MSSKELQHKDFPFHVTRSFTEHISFFYNRETFPKKRPTHPKKYFQQKQQFTKCDEHYISKTTRHFRLLLRPHFETSSPSSMNFEPLVRKNLKHLLRLWAFAITVASFTIYKTSGRFITWPRCKTGFFFFFFLATCWYIRNGPFEKCRQWSPLLLSWEGDAAFEFLECYFKLLWTSDIQLWLNNAVLQEEKINISQRGHRKPNISAWLDNRGKPFHWVPELLLAEIHRTCSDLKHNFYALIVELDLSFFFFFFQPPVHCLPLQCRHMFKESLIALHHTVCCTIRLRNVFQKSWHRTWITDKTFIPLGLNIWRLYLQVECLFWNTTLSISLVNIFQATSKLVQSLKKKKKSERISSPPDLACRRGGDYTDWVRTLK